MATLLVLIYLFNPRKGLNIAILNVSSIATYPMPLLFGVDYVTVIGIRITLLLAESLVDASPKKNN